MTLDTSAVATLFGDAYAVERRLGEGGMAIVFLADEKKHGRRVVLKLLRPEFTASVGAERFLREIQISARLTHPHIVPLIDSGQADGMLYYVSPFLADGSLRDRINAHGQLDVGAAATVVEEIASALDYAHRNGFVHRDVKPENILFSDGHALLADFGIARALCDTCENLTESGLSIGTPAYMSPEQAAGESDVGAPSDVYSLACVLYEMLTGEPVFDSAGSPRATIARHIAETPPSVRAKRPEVPAAIEAALARALSKDPSQRFQTAGDFVRACRRASAPPRTEATRSVAVLPFLNASSDPENEYLSDGITEELINTLAKVQRLRVTPRSTVFALKGKPQDPRAIGALLGVSYVLDGTVRQSGRRLRISAQLTAADTGELLWAERFDRELSDVFDVQEEIANTIAATLLSTPLSRIRGLAAPARAASVTAYRYYLRGRYAWNKRTDEGVVEAIKCFEQAIAEDATYAPAYAGLSDAYALHVDYRSVPVAQGYERAKTYARQAIALDETLAEAHASLAWALFIYDWDWPAAWTEFKRAIELDARYASAHQWYAFLLASQTRLEEALIEGHSAAELDPASVSIRRGLGWLYYYAHRFDDARSHLMRAIEMNPLAEETYRVLGLNFCAQNEYAEAERILREAVELPGSGAYTRSTLAYALGRLGKPDEVARIENEISSRSGYVSPMVFVMLALGRDDWQSAFDWMHRAKGERRGWLAYLRVNPLLDPVRDDPRLQSLISEMRLQ